MNATQANQGRLLNINLSSGHIAKQVLEPENLKRFIGGCGINAWLLFNMIDQETDPLGPYNPLIFGSGPLVGTSFPTGARSTVTALSPLTNIYGDSNAGGNWGVMMHSVGLDHLVITGLLKKPGYLFINAKGECSLKDASDLWGLTTSEAEKTLKNRHPHSIAAVIGPAGENLVRYANISFENNAHSFSRSGMGAVMGSKKLKAVVISRGAEKNPIQNPAELDSIAQEVKSWSKSLAFPRLFKKYGTMMFINLLESLGLMYAENWRRHIEPDDISEIDACAYFKAVESKDVGCYRCPLRCGKKWRILDGNFAGEQGHGYEVAYIMTLAITLGFRDIKQILHLANLINQKAFDINEFCGAVGMLIDACENGLIDSKMLDSIRPGWGDLVSIKRLIEQVANNRGIGAVLAQGTRGAAQIIGNGAKNYALHMKGMHWPAHSAPPFVLAFSLSPRGGDFLKGVPHLLMQAINTQTCKLLFGATRQTMDFKTHAEKGRAVWWHENYKMILDSLGICFYLGMSLLNHGKLVPAHLAAAWQAATGVNADGFQIQMAAERGYQIERAINTLRGQDRRHDSFSRRPEPDSWAEGIDLNKKGMLDEYYAYRGLSEDGLPTWERLEELGLTDVAMRLESIGRLGCAKHYSPLEKIIKNPAPAEFDAGLKMKIKNKIRTKIMNKMTQSPESLRQVFLKAGERQKRKQKSGLKKKAATG